MEIPDKIYLLMQDDTLNCVGTAWIRPVVKNCNIEYINKDSLIKWLLMLASKTEDAQSKVFFLNFIEQLKEF